MVINHNFQGLFESINENKVLNLPTLKENAIKLSFTSSHEQKTVYKGQDPLLPFAASKVYHAPIHSWRRLTALDENCKAVYEIMLDVKGSNLNFRPGDTIGIIPQNSRLEVDNVIEHLSIKDFADFSYTINIDIVQKKIKVPPHIPVESTVRHILTHCVDLRGVLKKLFLLALSMHTKDATEKRILEYLSSKEGSVAYTKHILNNHICLLDIFTMFKSCKPPIELLFEYLPRLLPRPYSIANSHRDNSYIKICFSVMDIGNNRKGVTTGWLEDIIIKHGSGLNLEEIMQNMNINDEGTKIPIYVRQNTNGFLLPESLNTPIILIASGAGISPFMGFLEERQNKDNNNPECNLGYAWLFFGCRNPNLDFLYEETLKKFVSKGVLNKLTTSFSRCGNTENCYVQDAIKQNGEELAKIILQGAHVYICGDVKKMAPLVREAIAKCLESYGDEVNDSEEFIANMIKEKKYLLDIWN